MVETRRKSRVAPTQEADTDAHDAAISIPDNIDQDELAVLLPDVDLHNPAPEAIVTFYRLLLAQAADLDASQRQLDEAQGETEKKEVELDQALQDRESIAKELESSLERLQEELNLVKQERDEFAQAQSSFKTEITSLSNSQSSSSSEVEALKHRVEDTEREKRDLVGVISRLKQESSQRDDEIQTLRSNLKEARQEHQVLEGQLRELQSIETSTKFKIDSLTQQLQLAQAEAERANVDLTTKTEEFAKYRRAKHAEMTNLQATYDTLSQTHASTLASHKALQSAHTAQTHQLTQALAKVQGLTGQLAEQEAKYASEATGLKRLVAMMEEREKGAKEVVDGIEREWAEVGERSERRESALKDEIERERRGRELAEKRLEQLEIVVEKIGRGELPVPGGGTAGTPIRTPGHRDLMTDGMMGLSPTVAMASRAQRSGKTFTEVYADYIRLQEDYARKSTEYEHMDRTLSSVLAQIEERAPILSQQRAEYERLQSEASQLASQLAQALAERDSQSNIVQEISQKFTTSTSENILLQKQLEDLGRQVQTLLREIARHDDPMIPSEEELNNMHVAPAEDTDSLITNHLVLFKSIDGMQEQNQKLLKIVRELGKKMESEEREYRDAMEREQGEAVREAHEAMQEMAAQLERQKKSNENLIQSYVKEIDALRSLLARAETLNGTSLSKSGVGEDISGDKSELVKELSEVQVQFDAYRTEMGVDAGRLRDELFAAQREANHLGATLAKANAKIEYLTESHRIAQDEFTRHNRAMDDLSKRNQQLYDQWTRIDIECSRVSEDLQVASGRLEQLRNECANLRAEKKIWEGVQGRLVEENRTLAMERSHLSDLMTNVQKMHNDLERSGENDRRRLENQLQMLEGQTQDLRTQINHERDTVRHVTLQKDIELKELQNKLDKSVHELSKTRESLISAETSKKHYEERVEELTRHLKGNEEKLAVYERRATATNGPIANTDPELTREQQLEAEVAELRSALKVAEVDLATAKSHVQQFKEISQANEEALASLNSTYDEYKTSTEAQLARHDSESKALQEKLQTAQEELTQFTEKYNDNLKTSEAERAIWAADKKTLEDTIVDLSTSEKHLEIDRTSREQESRQLEDRVKAAEDRYSHEVLAHADSIKAIDSLKQELNTIQSSARNNFAIAKTAEAKLESSENSWKQQKDTLDKEVADLNARCRDLSSQNTILHQHLESVSTQAARIRQAADSSSAQTVDGGENSEDADTKIAELRSVVTYLRKEKEIVDLQLELSKQENTRLKSQIEHLSQTLQETRTTLSEERERAVENAASAAQHAELVERINQLNILRESNATLRADCESHAKKSRDLEAKLTQLTAELDPAKEQARIALAEVEVSKNQILRLEQESRRWQERNTQLLSKYDRIDPAEVQLLRDEIESLKTRAIEAAQQKASLEEAETSHKETIAEQVNRISIMEENLKKYKEINGRNSEYIKKRLAEIASLKGSHVEEKNQLEAKISALENEISNLRQAKESTDAGTAASASTSSADAVKQASQIATLQEERDKLLAEKAAWTQLNNGTAVPPVWETEKVELVKSRDEALTKIQAAMAEVQSVNEAIKGLKTQNVRFKNRIIEMQKSKLTDAEKAQLQQEAAVSAALEQAKSELPAPAPGSEGELVKRHGEELRSLEEKLTLKHQSDLEQAVEAAVQASLKTNSTTPDGDQKLNIDTAVAAAIAEHEAQFQARRAEEIAEAVERGRMEQVAKGKLKDSQLVKAQKKVKDLEAQILEWRKAGILPETTTPATGTAASTSTASQAPVSVTTTPAGQTSVKPAVNTTAGTLPRKPSMPTTPTSTTGAVTRGGAPVRGAVPGRGVGRGGAVRGGAPVRTAPAKAPAAAAAAGMSIMGAAAKRPREEGEPGSDDSLAKRLKPVEGTAKPVAIRRPPVP